MSAATSADATLWFEGVFAREPVLAIRILDPSGQVVLESESPDGYVGGAVGGTSFRVAQRVTLSPAGTWSIAFEGRGSPSGHAEIRT